MTTTAPLFPDLEAPHPRVKVAAPVVTRNPALRTAQYFSRAMCVTRDKARKSECYLKMVAAILAKDNAK